MMRLNGDPCSFLGAKIDEVLLFTKIQKKLLDILCNLTTIFGVHVAEILLGRKTTGCLADVLFFGFSISFKLFMTFLNCRSKIHAKSTLHIVLCWSFILMLVEST